MSTYYVKSFEPIYLSCWKSSEKWFLEPIMKEYEFRCFPANKSLTFINVVQRWYLVENESWADVHLSTLFQRWRNNVETILIELRRFNVDKPTLFQRWNLVENESWADVCLSTLFQRWQNNVETTLIELRWFNVDDPMLFQRWY